MKLLYRIQGAVMKRKPNVKPLLLSSVQIMALQAIPQQEAERSPQGSINEVVRH